VDAEIHATMMLRYITRYGLLVVENANFSVYLINSVSIGACLFVDPWQVVSMSIGDFHDGCLLCTSP
jgi:hypothetical protein